MQRAERDERIICPSQPSTGAGVMPGNSIVSSHGRPCDTYNNQLTVSVNLSSPMLVPIAFIELWLPLLCGMFWNFNRQLNKVYLCALQLEDTLIKLWPGFRDTSVRAVTAACVSCTVPSFVVNAKVYCTAWSSGCFFSGWEMSVVNWWLDDIRIGENVAESKMATAEESDPIFIPCGNQVTVSYQLTN